MRKMYEPVVCADGFKFSIQGNATAYCSPRDNSGPYVSVEVGYPSREEAKLLQYAEDPQDPTNTVYGWVPSSVVLEVIDFHGGWACGELPPLEINAEESL